MAMDTLDFRTFLPSSLHLLPKKTHFHPHNFTVHPFFVLSELQKQEIKDNRTESRFLFLQTQWQTFVFGESGEKWIRSLNYGYISMSFACQNKQIVYCVFFFQTK